MTLTFSNAHLWANCAASVSPVPGGGIHDEPSEAAQEGSAAAWVIDGVLRGSAASAAEFNGEQAPNGWPVDFAMTRHAQGYIDLVRSHGPVASEVELSLWDGLVRGRTDTHSAVQNYDPVGDEVPYIGAVLKVWDFKYGYRIHEPYGNPQLLLPAIALVQPHHTSIELGIVQPRPHHPAGPVRIWTLTPLALQSWAQTLWNRATGTLDPGAPALPGRHCEYCPRRSPSLCHALGANLGAMYELAADTRRTGKLTAGELAAELDFLEMTAALLKARSTGAQAEANARIAAGEMVPGWCRDPRSGKREFTKPPEMVRMLTGLDPYEPAKLKTPAALEREGAHPETMNLISHVPFAGYELRRWNAAVALKAFAPPSKGKKK